MKINKKYIKIINYILVLFIIVSLILSLTIAFFRMSGADLNIGGMHLFKIISGSMEPKYKIGDYVVSFKKSPDKLKENSIIAYISGDEVFVHRIVTINDDGSFITRGDANPVDDYSTVIGDQIIGRVAFKLPLLKFMDSLFSGIGSFIILIVLPLAFMIINEIINLIYTEKRRREAYRIIMNYGLDPKDEKLFEITNKYGEDAIKQIVLSTTSHKENIE